MLHFLFEIRVRHLRRDNGIGDNKSRAVNILPVKKYIPHTCGCVNRAFITCICVIHKKYISKLEFLIKTAVVFFSNSFASFVVVHHIHLIVSLLEIYVCFIRILVFFMLRRSI